MDDLKKGYPERRTGNVRRFCQYLDLNPATLEQYRFWHNPRNIWPEIPEGIRRAGILDMEIYLCGTRAVMILETPEEFDWDTAFGKLATFDRQAEWEAFVAAFQQADPAMRSEQKWSLAERIFALSETQQIEKNDDQK